ncbi:TlpA disulfide reductase family protein [soil metagenome]
MSDADVSASRSRVAPFVALGIAVVLAVLFVVLVGAKRNDQESAGTALMDQPAPVARGLLDDGTPFDLARRKGSWVVVNFFDSECPPCRAEHPELVGFAESQAARGPAGAELVTVVFGDADGVRSFFADNGGDWPVVYDDRGAIPDAFGVTKVPETWIIDPDGFIRWRTIATVTADQLDGVIARLTQQRQG